MKKKVLSMILATAMVATMVAGCGNKDAGTDTASEGKETTTETTKAEEKTDTKDEGTGGKEKLTFYHAYYHDEATWPAAVAMREIYQEFADAHANDDCTFEAVPVEDVTELATNELAGGTFPNMVDFAGMEVPLAAISQGLVLDMKDYIDKEGLESKVGINYTMNQVDGKIYTVHDQLTTLGLWYNADLYEAAGATTPDTWTNYEDMAAAMNAITTYGSSKGIYAYSAGQGSIRLFNAYMGLLNKEYASGALTADIINSDEFATAFKAIAAMDQANGSANTSDDVGSFSSDVTSGLCATFLNGVWGAGSFTDTDINMKPAIYPGNVSLSAPGGGLTIAADLSDAQKALALEFVKYMTSDEVQQKIFLEINANPCNTDLDLTALAEGSDNATVKLLAEACSLANSAKTIVSTTNYVWGADVQTAIINKLIECSVSGTDIDAKLAELQGELVALIG
ncbi:MAG: extracellular solute-binding protein [Lachnospiraceae bacterium]|nr:extracellular solute-binding protein [Lachnospiraceae bacterium]